MWTVSDGTILSSPAGDFPAARGGVGPRPGATEDGYSPVDKIGRYEVIGEVGRGGMGIVYKAHDPVIGRDVAIKCISIPQHLQGKKQERFLQRFYREAQAAGRLSHPHILTIYDIGEHRGLPYITMEFLSGRTLEKILEEKGRLSIEAAKAILSQTCDALEFAHDRGIIHRDVKPSNIFLTNAGMVKVMDFGIARLADGESTDTSHIIGSPSYISPEYLKGDPVDRRSDIFSLGVTLYQILTGEKPFPGESIAAIFQMIVADDPIPPSQIQPSLPSGCDLVILKALQKNPEKRYAKASEMAGDFMGVEDLRSRTGMKVEVRSGESPREDAAPSQTERIFQEVTTTVRRSRTRRSAGLWQWIRDYFSEGRRTYGR